MSIEKRPPPDPSPLGRHGEDLAADHLERAGYHILDRNVRVGRLEIDIVATIGDTLVIVEVKTRSSRFFGMPEESVGWHKQRRLVRATARLLQHGSLPRKNEIRFDVISVLMDGASATVEHLPGAFEVEPGGSQ
jgi:putative endonuclease